jgi:hypothetical protein
MSDPERIWLQPGPPGDRDDDCPGDTEYVRADLVAATWRPIITAPKDGTDFLTFQDGHVSLNSCNARSNYFADSTWWVNPSHWMPLPPPPTADAAKGD